MFGLGPLELIIFAVIILVLFGNRLPSVMRSLGQGLVEFKKGVKGIEDEVSESRSPRQSIEPEPVKPPQRVTPTSAPKFDDAAPSTLPPKV